MQLIFKKKSLFSKKKMKLISFANYNHGGLVNLKNSLTNKNWEHCIIGKGVKWEGWTTRCKSYISFLSQLNKDEIVVLCDAFDVLCLKSSDDFLSKFESLNRSIVIGAETTCCGNCVPLSNWWLNEIGDVHTTSQYKYCNGGLLAGKVESLLIIYQWILDKKIEDDQMGLGHYINEFPEKIWLDHEQVLFFNDGGAQKKYDFNKFNYSITFNDKQQITPFFIHFPGFSNTGSIPLLNLLHPKSMFNSGKNYVSIGNILNGKQQINALPMNKPLFLQTIWTERAIYLAIILLILIAIVFFVSKKN